MYGFAQVVHQKRSRVNRRESANMLVGDIYPFGRHLFAFVNTDMHFHSTTAVSAFCELTYIDCGDLRKSGLPFSI